MKRTARGRCDAFVSLLRDVAATSRKALELVSRSQGRHYGGGKLRLRSDHDLLVAALVGPRGAAGQGVRVGGA